MRLCEVDTAMKARFSDEMTLDEIMHEWPKTIRIMLDHGLLCVGCPIASFHTLSDAAREHGIDPGTLSQDLRLATK